MKPMTESEARAALKAEMPWASRINVSAPTDGLSADVEVFRGPVSVLVYAPTLRAAVAKAIKAWRATQPKREIHVKELIYGRPQQKGAKR